MIPTTKPKKQPTIPLEPAELGDESQERDDYQEPEGLGAHGHGEQKDAERQAEQTPGTGATHGED